MGPKDPHARYRLLALAASSYRPVQPWLESTGFRTHAARYGPAGPARDARVAEEFLINSRMARHDAEFACSVAGYFDAAAALALSQSGRGRGGGLPEVPLPGGAPMPMAVGDAIAARRSRRQYSGEPVRLAALASLLRAAAGETAAVEVEIGDARGPHPLRAVSSAGGLYPIDLYVAALKIDGLEPGVYRYDAADDALRRRGDAGAAEGVRAAFSAPEELISLGRAGAILLFVATPWRSMRKYGPRGMRFVFLEAGAMAQAVHLAATALGLGAVDCASFYDDELGRPLGIDGAAEAVVHAVVLGRRQAEEAGSCR
jgi:SagB-type dehydrogenase family enzyme